MSQARKSRFPAIFVGVFTFFFVVLCYPRVIGLPLGGLLNHQEDVWQDFLYRLHAGSIKDGDSRIIVLAVDEESGKQHGFPLPRSVYAKALDRMKALGVKTVVFDVMFFEKRDAAQDAEFAAATKRFGKVLHLFQYEPDESDYEKLVVNHPIEGLRKASEITGFPNVDAVLDSDGRLRRARLFEDRLPDPNKKFSMAPALEIGAAHSFLGAKPEELEARFIENGAPRVLFVNFRRGRDWPRHAKRDAGKSDETRPTVYSPYRRLSMLDLISGSLTDEEKAALKGSIVMIGSTALGYYDHYATPFAHQAPGVDHHANIFDNLLNEDFRRVPPGAVMPLVAVFMCLVPLALLSLPPAAGAAGALALTAAWVVYGSHAFGDSLRVDVIRPVVALLSSYLVLVVHRARTEGAEKQMIKGMFGQFVAPEVVEELANNPEKAKLGAQKRDMTVLFLDIAHFTTISEKMGPEALIQFLNKYLSALSLEILERRGTIDKYIGDCVMAFWNAPLENKNHRLDACLAAIACQDKIEELNKDLDPGLPEIPAIRIGLNSGFMNVGFTGTDRKLQYTVIGDEVNLASRLEGANKFFGSRIMVSESVYEGAKDAVVARVLGRVRVVGKSIPIKVYELIAEKGKVPERWQKALPVYEKLVAAFDAGKFDEAVTHAEAFLKLVPKDGPAELYKTISTDYAAIPPDNWDGVFNLTAK